MDRRAFRLAVEIFRDLKGKGVTLKNPTDTFIAAAALEHEVHILHNDSDFDLIGSHCPLKTVPPAP